MRLTPYSLARVFQQSRAFASLSTKRKLLPSSLFLFKNIPKPQPSLPPTLLLWLTVIAGDRAASLRLHVVQPDLAEDIERTARSFVVRFLQAGTATVAQLGRIRGQRDQREVLAVVALREVREHDLCVCVWEKGKTTVIVWKAHGYYDAHLKLEQLRQIHELLLLSTDVRIRWAASRCGGGGGCRWWRRCNIWRRTRSSWDNWLRHTNSNRLDITTVDGVLRWLLNRLVGFVRDALKMQKECYNRIHS